MSFLSPVEPAPAIARTSGFAREAAALVLLTALTVIARIGMLGTAEVWWEDEHTFGLMAQDVLRGNLPYVEAFDNKPPVLFLLLALFLKIFGNDFIGLRAFGDVSVFVTAVLVRAMMRPVTGEGAALLAAVVLIGLSAFPIAQATLSEWPAIMFVTAALLCVLRRPSSAPAAFGSGILMAFAVLTRTNLAFAAVAMGGVLAASPFLRGPYPLRSLAAFVVGGLVPLAGLFLLYGLAGRLDLLILGMIRVPLSYTDGAEHLRYFLFTFTELRAMLFARPLTTGPLAFVCLTASLLLLLRRVGRFRSADPAPVAADRWRDSMIAAVGLAVLLSVLRSGGAGAHYLVQLFPFLAFNVARIVGPSGTDDPVRPMTAAAGLLAALLPIAPVAPLSIAALRDPVGQVHDTPQWRASRFIAGDRRPGDRVWALHQHVVLVHLDEPPIARVGVHPGNMTVLRIIRPLAEAGYAPAEPLWAYAALGARYVIAPRGFLTGERSIFYLDADQAVRLRAMLARDYEVGFAEDDVEVLKRRD